VRASGVVSVAPSAPYRHFADRDALLAAVALRAAGLLAEQLERTAASGTPAQRLAAAARAYVRFADRQRPLFQALAGSGSARTATPRSHKPRRPSVQLSGHHRPSSSPAAAATLALISGRESLICAPEI
jgi:AcrR family transcriptional regulator